MPQAFNRHKRPRVGRGACLGTGFQRCGYIWIGLGVSGAAGPVTLWELPALLRASDVDAALEEGAVLDADARRGHVAGQSAFGADVDPVGGGDIAAHLAQNDDFAGGDAGGDLAVAAHGDAVAGQGDAALDLAVDKQRLGAGDLSLDNQALADGGLVAGRKRGRDLRVQTAGAGGAGREGSGAGLRVYGSGLAGFPHCAHEYFLFCPDGTGLPRQGPLPWAQNLNVRTAGLYARQPMYGHN